MPSFVGGPAGAGSVLLACGDYKKLVFTKKYMSWTWCSSVVQT